MNATPLPGSRWFQWVRSFTLRVGVLTGLYLTAVMVISVLAATRVGFLEPYADVRNGVAYAAFGFVLLIPIGCFLRAPIKLFAAGICGWAILTVNYALMGLFFVHLHDRLGKTPFHMFILGALVYGVAAVMSWVAGMVLSLREQPIAATRRRM
ncbi:MAG: hypothetical protein M1453_08625 [Acidobacteria bacterium]|nr:hypothetical protein [Acidobacteriota bacterium]